MDHSARGPCPTRRSPALCTLALPQPPTRTGQRCAVYERGPRPAFYSGLGPFARLRNPRSPRGAGRLTSSFLLFQSPLPFGKGVPSPIPSHLCHVWGARDVKGAPTKAPDATRWLPQRPRITKVSSRWLPAYLRKARRGPQHSSKCKRLRNINNGCLIARSLPMRV
eukprot:9492432-Pyramimonas_sp.AAC.1